MKKKQKLTDITKHISRELLDSIYLLRILTDIVEEDGKLSTLSRIIQNKTKTAFSKIEKCRKILNITD